MKLVTNLAKAIWDEYGTYKDVRFYIDKWYESDDLNWQNFQIHTKKGGDIDLLPTLHSIDGEILLKMAIDVGVETPDFISSIPVFRNEIKSEYKTASSTFEKAFKQIETHPDIAIGLANSTLESIIKEILNDDRIIIKSDPNKTLYDLTVDLLKEFNVFPKSDMPKEIKTIGSSLLAACQAIEQLRSEKTTVHGKVEGDYIIEDSLYTYFIVNSITTVGLFLNSFYKNKFPKLNVSVLDNDELPF